MANIRVKVKNPFYGPTWPFMPEFHIHEGEVVPTPKWINYPAIAMTTGQKAFTVRIVPKEWIVEIDGVKHEHKEEKISEERTFTVAGSKGSSYTVTVGPKLKTCTCQGFQFRHTCKHIAQIAA